MIMPRVMRFEARISFCVSGVDSDDPEKRWMN
jgi:hypothetical protein